MEAGLEKLSVLIPLAGSEKLQLLLQRQLEQWHQTKLDGTIDESTFSGNKFNFTTFKCSFIGSTDFDPFFQQSSVYVKISPNF